MLTSTSIPADFREGNVACDRAIARVAADDAEVER